jgi:2-aminoadipate transaminase
MLDCRPQNGPTDSRLQRMKAHALSELGHRTEEPPISWLMATALAQPHLISLAAGFTDNESLPVKEVRGLLDEILRSPRTGQAALQYGTTAGDPALRELTAGHLQSLDGQRSAGKAYSPERMIITNGSQQMLYMVTEALCDTGDIVLVEDPSYFVYLGILQSHGVRARGVRIEKDGLDLNRLEAVLEALKRSGELRRVKLLYLVSYYQNPTGLTTSFAKIKDSHDRLIYAGTYSKPFATGTRVGFGIMPEPVLSAVLRIKGNHDFGSSNLLQQLLARALSSGRYEKHLAELQARYAHKAQVMRKALTEHFPPQVEWWEPNGGLYFWARLPHSISSSPKSKFFQKALKSGVLYVPGELCYADDPTRRKPNHEMRLSYGGATKANVGAGIARLGAVVRDFLQR